MSRTTSGALIILALLGPWLPSMAARRESLEFRHSRISLPGAPAVILPDDFDADGLTDLLVVVAFTEVESIGVDRIENAVQISTVVPAVFDRREVRLYRGTADGRFESDGIALELAPSVLAVSRGPSGCVLLLTDAGVSRICVDAEGRLELTPLLDDPPVLAGAGSFFAGLRWTADLTGDGTLDLLFPSRQGLAIYRGTDETIESRPFQRLELQGDRRGVGAGAWRDFPVPEVEDVDGDGRPDLVVSASGTVDVWRGTESGRFEELHGEAECPEAACRVAGIDTSDRDTDLVYYGDLDGDHRAEIVLGTDLRREGDGLFAGMKEAKRPRQTFRLFRSDGQMNQAAEPYFEFTATGHAGFDVDTPRPLFRDLDGDGRKDLITVTLDFSLFQAVRILTTKRMSVGLDFHIWAQRADGTFREVTELNLSEKLKLDLRDLRLGRLAQFSGDFDGDGKIDFTRLGLGKEISIHRGQDGCRYKSKADAVIELEEEPQNLALVRVEDLDGDGRSDIAITRVLESGDEMESAPVVLDLYLSSEDE